MLDMPSTGVGETHPVTVQAVVLEIETAVPAGLISCVNQERSLPVSKFEILEASHFFVFCRPCTLSLPPRGRGGIKMVSCNHAVAERKHAQCLFHDHVTRP